MQVRRILQSIPIRKLRDAGLLGNLLELGGLGPERPEAGGSAAGGEPESIDDLDMESLITMALDGTASGDAT